MCHWPRIACIRARHLWKETWEQLRQRTVLDDNGLMKVCAVRYDVTCLCNCFVNRRTNDALATLMERVQDVLVSRVFFTRCAIYLSCVDKLWRDVIEVCIEAGVCVSAFIARVIFILKKRHVIVPNENETFAVFRIEMLKSDCGGREILWVGTHFWYRALRLLVVLFALLTVSRFRRIFGKSSNLSLSPVLYGLHTKFDECCLWAASVYEKARRWTLQDI